MSKTFEEIIKELQEFNKNNYIDTDNVRKSIKEQVKNQLNSIYGSQEERRINMIIRNSTKGKKNKTK